MAQKPFAEFSGTLLITAILTIAVGSWTTVGRAQEKVQVHEPEADAKAIKQVFAEWYGAFSRHDARTEPSAAMTHVPRP